MKQLIRTLQLFALLCASSLGQPAEVSAQISLSDDQFVKSCAGQEWKLLKIAVRDRDGRYVDKVPIWQFPNSDAFFFTSGMTIDADGAPNAYNPDDTGLDELANAGSPNSWNGIITDRQGNPLIQQASDPFPGYYISCTALADKTKEFSEPSRYVDATKIPYIALPEEIAQRGGARLGDFAFVLNLRNGKSSYAIYADIGTVGEGSVALAKTLGISANARDGGDSEGMFYMLFPGSGNMKPRTLGEIESEGEKLLSYLTGMRNVLSCSEEDNDPEFDGGQL